MYLIGLDIGTTSVCGIMCDAESGKIVQSVTKPNPGFLPTHNPWEKLQDPVKLADTLLDITEILSKNSTPACIGVTGQMHGIIYLDSEGEPVSPLMTWQDGRGDLPFREDMTYAEYLSKKTGYSLSTGYGAVTHFYNTVNNLIPENAVTFCTVHDFAVMKLTGRKTPLLHPSDAASFGLYDLKNAEFDKNSILAGEMDSSFFPQVSTGFTLAGKTTNDIPVSVAIGDNQASVLGSVNSLSDTVLVNVGTGSQISCVVSCLPEKTKMECRPLIDGYWMLVGSSLCGGRAYAILERLLRETAELVCGKKIESAYPAMDKLMSGFDSETQPLCVNTTFSGTRQNPALRGSITQIGIDNLTVANLCDGFMCGMVNELYGLYTEMKPMLKELPKQLVGSGNGIRFNKPLTRRFSETFGLPISIPGMREEAAFGAALFAGVSSGVYNSIEQAQQKITYIDEGY